MTLAHTFEFDPEMIQDPGDLLAGLKPTEQRIREIHNRPPEGHGGTDRASFMTLRHTEQAAGPVTQADRDTAVSETTQPTTDTLKRDTTLTPSVRAKGHLALVVNNP